MKNILLVEDQYASARVISDYLKSKGYALLHAPNLRAADHYLDTKQIDLILMDILLRDGNGLDYTRLIRQRKHMQPLIFLTVCARINEIRAGFELGCEDYMTKPVDLEELLLRIKRVLGDMNTAVGHFRRIGSYKFNPVSQCLHHENEVQNMGNLEASVLNELSIVGGEIVTKEALMEKFWMGVSYYSSRNLDSVIVKLRKRLSRDPHVRILSVKRHGYRLVIE
jgi:two-component system, OmpR family, response regulator TrcR